MAIDAIGASQLNAPQTERSDGGGERFAAALTRFMHEVNSDQLEAAM